MAKPQDPSNETSSYNPSAQIIPMATQEPGPTLAESAWTIQALLENEFPPFVPRIGPIANGMCALIAAPTGVGKTQVAVGMHHAMATGQEFLGMAATEGTQILHIDGEMSGHTLQNRFSMYAWPEDHTKRLIFKQAMLEGGGIANFAEPAWQHALLAAMQHFDVLILDNVYSLVNVPGQSMSSDLFWKSVAPMNAQLRSMDKTIIWFDHTSTAGKAFGTQTKEWEMDVVGVMEAHGPRQRKHTSFRLEWKKIRSDLEGPQAITAEMECDSMGMAQWQWRADTSREERFEKIAEAINEGRSYQEISTVLNVSNREIARVKKELGGR